MNAAHRKLLESENNRCYYCKREFGLGFSRRTIDHKVPLSNGGEDAEENLVLACKACNHLKGSKSEEDFIKTLPSILEWRKNYGTQ